jgi:hypothetical protein
MRALGTLAAVALTAAIVVGGVAEAASAAVWYGGPGYRERVFRGPPPRVAVGPRWATGRWVHGWYGGRYGWWWAVGPSWYWYPRPVYPYPVYVPAYDDPNYVPEAGYPPPQNVQPQAQSWYYCANPQGYYPEVRDCDHWQEVPASPPPNQDPAPNQ